MHHDNRQTYDLFLLMSQWFLYGLMAPACFLTKDTQSLIIFTMVKLLKLKQEESLSSAFIDVEKNEA